MDINFNNLTLRDYYDDGIKRGKDKTFIFYQRINQEREEFSYNFIAEQADKLIERLQTAGLKKGDRVGIISSLRPMWYALHYACLKAGFIMVCMDPGIPSAQLKNMMLETDCRAVFTTSKSIHLPKELEEHIPVYFVDVDFPLISKCDKVSILLDDGKKLPDNTFYVLFSSGTTGENRKAVLIAEETITKAIEYNMSTDTGVYKNETVYQINEKDLVLFPPYHIAGLLKINWDIYCNTQVIMLERLTPNCLMSAMQELQPDNISTVPSMLTSLYKKILAGFSNKPLLKTIINTSLNFCGFLRKNFGIKLGRKLFKQINKKAFGGNVKSFTIGASPFDEEPNRFYLNMGIDVVMAYGLTELGAPMTCTGPGYYPGTAGRVVRHTDKIDVRIINKDENGRGEIEILSPFRMISYMNPKDNEDCFTKDGYFKTGDLGYFDSNDCLNICGRIKETIVLRNGEKLLPEEIEKKYQELDCVKEIIAFKVPDEGGCDAFSIAIIKDKEKGIPDEAMKVRVYERAEHLPVMYRPKDVYVLKEFPLSSTHKVQRFRLTQMAVEGLDAPVTDASMVVVDEDETTAELRKILIEVGGSQWKNVKLTQGLLLNLDSLSIVNLYVGIQEKWGIDLFESTSQPETFGELLDIVKNFDKVDKNDKADLDLSKYPLKAPKINVIAVRSLEKLVKSLYHVRGYGKKNFPKDTNFIICSNHRTDIDPAFICNCLPKDIMKNTCIVGKAELVEDKIFKQFVVAHNFIPVDRTGNSIQTLDRCKELLEEGYNILIFPEGTSVENHTKLFPLKEGPARLSISTGKPIVPACISGIKHKDEEMGEFGLPIIKGARVKVNFGKPIEPKDMTPKQINEVLTKAIEELNFD